MRKPEIQKWIDGLRSGKYKQAFGTICTPYNNSMCCLGVLGVVNEKITGKDFDSACFLGYNFATELLGRTIQNDCQRLNDQEKLTFSQIADKVEEMFPNA